MKRRSGTGCFITFEGGDGSGKSTQSRLLAEYLDTVRIECLLTREPGGAPGAEDIRTLLVTGEVDRWDAIGETLLFNAARRNHLRLTIWPALDAGKWVISDRFADSTMAYQGYGNGLGVEAVQRIHDFTFGHFAPDLTFIFDLPAEEGLNRTRGRHDGEDRFEKMDLSFHDRLRDGFLEIAAKNPARCVVIDALKPVEDIQKEIYEIVKGRLLS
tara:strand:+ start:466 stop:1107 length:642 start_codon:yes stop_codon:yes gene_type:complete